jgi:peptidoglycan/LPS O-acetylase OafA/YrhL
MKERLLELDAMRGMAALAVVLFHFTINRNAAELGWRFSYGVTGVDIFFMISGFVIFLTINNTTRWQGFVKSRFSRLYPTYWTCVLLTSLCMFIYEPGMLTLPKVLANLTMFPSYFGIEDLDGSYWTLLIELLFYVWMLLIYLSKSSKNIVNIGLIFTAAIIAFHFFGNYYPRLYLVALQKVQLINHFPLFLSGIIFFKLKYESFRLRYIIYCIFCIMSAIYLHDKGGRTMYILTQFEHGMMIVFYHIVFALFILGRLTFLNLKPFLFLGKISYSLYLLHQYIGLNLIETFKSFGTGIHVAILLCVSICIVMAWLVTTYIEVPAVQFFRGQPRKTDTSPELSTEKQALNLDKASYH